MTNDTPWRYTPGPGDELVFFTNYRGEQAVYQLSAANAQAPSNDRDRAILRALLTLALARLDEQ